MLRLPWLGVVVLALLTVSPPVLAQKRIALVGTARTRKGGLSI